MEVTIDGVRYVPAARDEVVLSVLVPSVSSRRASFAPKIAEALFSQHEALSIESQRRVEILMLTDAKGMLVGDKRNAMVRMARGTYVVFVDDDDRIEPDYLNTLLNATERGADCITFDAMVSLNGAAPKRCNYSLKYSKDANAPDHYQRLPNHITAVRRVLALACPFPSKQFGEDADYAARLRPSLKTAWHIERVLYHYDFNETTTETQGKPRLAVVPTPQTGPLVDVVILSKASTPELRAMCQKAIDTCIAGAGGPSELNITVIEQNVAVGGKYSCAQTLYDEGTFNYNQFANNAARRGNAPWIMVANSDLIFEDGWLDALLEVNRDCVSPVDPSHKTQKNVRHDEAGWQNGHHFSGWCFMVRRTLWERMQGFDECVSYWCSDNVVIEQCRALNVMPLLVAKARVRHLVSQTAKKPPDDDTWAQVRTFNAKYPQRAIFRADSRYLTYCRKNGLAA